ncbi:MAG: hypothetical protein K2Y39_17550 [Candidatus Obscuribacterales bacterium]|nr:hypothetical protein [Candidatus Obscuribacterales bacterium]
MTLAAAMFARPVQCVSAYERVESQKTLFAGDMLVKVRAIWEAARLCKFRVPDILQKESRNLNSFEFAALMLSVEEHGLFWFESERFFVFCNPSGNVSSVWLGGSEVYNSIWNNNIKR